MSTKPNKRKKMIYSRLTVMYWSLGVSFTVLAVIIFIFGAAYDNITVSALAFAVFSAGLGCMGASMNRKADSRMEAMANLEFDEKLSVMAGYGRLEELWLNSVYYDIRAALRLEPWVDDSTRHEFSQVFGKVTNQAESDGEAKLVIALKELAQQYNIVL